MLFAQFCALSDLIRFDRSAQKRCFPLKGSTKITPPFSEVKCNKTQLQCDDAQPSRLANHVSARLCWSVFAPAATPGRFDQPVSSPREGFKHSTQLQSGCMLGVCRVGVSSSDENDRVG